MKEENIENLADKKAERREQKRKPRMKQHGRDLKKPTDRTASHIAKAEKKK